MQDCPVCDFGLTVGLRVSDGSQPMLNIVLGIEIFEFLVVELPAIVDDDDMRDAESKDYMASDETLHLAFCNKGQRFSLNPFHEVVYGY